MLAPEHSRPLGYVFDPKKETEIYGYGDFLRKTVEYLKDHPEKVKLQGRANNLQNTSWCSSEPYLKAIQRLDKDVADFVAIHQNPFIL